MRTTLVRVVLLIVLVLLGSFLFVIGREHKIFIDNQNITTAENSYQAHSEYKVWVDGEKVGRTTVKPGKRQVAVVSGPNHQILLVKVEDGKETGFRLEKDFKIPLSQLEVIINIPALTADDASWLQERE